MSGQRICQLTSGHSLDDERILHRFAISAARMGFESYVVGPSNKPVEVRDGVQLISCPKIKGNLSWAKRLRGLFSIFWWSIRNKSDIYQIHDPDLLLVGILLRFAGRKVIYDVHDDYEQSLRTRFYRENWINSKIPLIWWFFEKYVAKRLSYVFVADSHLKSKFSFTQHVTFGNFPMLDFIEYQEPVDHKPFRIIYVGGVTRVRGIGILVEAFQHISKDLDIIVDIVGPCNDQQLLEMLINDSRFILHGKKDWRELHTFYKNANLGVALYQPLPVFDYYPGENSVKIIEYMAAGIPVLASNFKGLRKFIDGQAIGVTVDPTDPKEVAKVIIELASDFVRVSEYGKKGRMLFETDYNWDIKEKHLKSVYESLMD